MNKSIMNSLRLSALVASVLSLVIVTSCDNGKTCEEKNNCPPEDALIALIEANPDYSEFATFIDANSTLLPDISGTDEYTLFVPNNAAFTKLKTTLDVDDLTGIRADVIASVLAYHYVSGKNTSLTAGGTLTTKQGETLTINADGTLLNGGSDDMVEIVSSAEATNGYLYETETILIPPSLFAEIVKHLGKVSQTVFLGAEFTILADVINKADAYADTAGVTLLEDLLASADTSVTLFAPSNATFEAAADADSSGSASEAELAGFMAAYTGQQFYGIVANHVVPSIVAEGSLVTDAQFTTAVGGTLTVFNNTSAIPADNGVGIYLDGNGDFDSGDLAGTGANLDAEIVYPPSISGITPSNGSIYIIAGLLVP